MNQHRVIFLPSGLKSHTEKGGSILSAALSAGEDIASTCGGKGACGRCKIKILNGQFDEYHIESGMASVIPAGDDVRDRFDLAPDEHLACQTLVERDVVAFIPEESREGRLVIRKETGSKTIPIHPIIRKYAVKLAEPSLEDTTSDLECLFIALKSQYTFSDLTIDHVALKTLAQTLRKNNWEVTVTIWDDKEIIRIEPPDSKAAFGLAVDVGTTSVAGYLCDLVSGAVVAADSMINPQAEFGEDVITRIAYASTNPDSLAKMNREIISGLNQLAANIAGQNGLSPHDITDSVIVANTAIHHMLLGLDVKPLGQCPFTPSLRQSITVKARDLGLDLLPSAYVHVLPIEAGYVGADNVGVLIAAEPYNQDEMLLIIDIGTNGELILGNRRRLMSCSCATGPAFEGASIKFGMRAVKGSIDKVRIDPKTLDVRFSVIGNERWNTDPDGKKPHARGICGSGIIDAVAEMFHAGIIKKNGGFNKQLKSPRLIIGKETVAEFVIAWAAETAIGRDITVTQQDVRAIQLAKAALYAGAKLMLNRMGVHKPDKVILAGAFGTVIDKKRALSIGMFPGCGYENIFDIGNAAGDGARFALLNKEKRLEAERVARQVEYIELTAEPGFQEAFLEATQFPHMTDPFPPVNGSFDD